MTKKLPPRTRKPPRGGRPSKYTPDRIEKFLSLVRAGNYQVVAAQAVGWGESTLHEYKNNHPEFLEAVKEAEASGEAVHVARIAKAAQDGVWTASAWWLERKHYDRWGRRERVQHEGSDGQPLVVKMWQPRKQRRKGDAQE